MNVILLWTEAWPGPRSLGSRWLRHGELARQMLRPVGLAGVRSSSWQQGPATEDGRRPPAVSPGTEFRFGDA